MQPCTQGNYAAAYCAHPPTQNVIFKLLLTTGLLAQACQQSASTEQGHASHPHAHSTMP